MVHTSCRPTNAPASHIDTALEEPHYEVKNDNWRTKDRYLKLPRLRIIQQRIKDAHSMS